MPQIVLEVGKPITKDLLLSLLYYPIREITEDTTVSLSDNNSLLAATEIVTFTLPVIPIEGFHVRFKNLANNDIEIVTEGCLIDACDMSLTLETDDSVHLATDGANWFVLSAGFINTSALYSLQEDVAELQQRVNDTTIGIASLPRDKKSIIKIPKGSTLTPAQEEILRKGGFVIYLED